MYRLLAVIVLFQVALPAQQVDTPESSNADARIMGVIPNYMTVSDPTLPFVPLTRKQKWDLFLKSAADPYTFGSALFGAAFSQDGNNDPKYGNGARGYAERFGAAVADFDTQNFYTGYALAVLLHEDPRYFRRGPKSSILFRMGYALSQTVSCRTDSGKRTFNFAGIVGTGMGIVTSDLYYPESSHNGSVLWSRVGTSVMGTGIGNLMSEFWPDIRIRLIPRIWPRKKS
jgi:hypothetical protein